MIVNQRLSADPHYRLLETTSSRCTMVKTALLKHRLCLLVTLRCCPFDSLNCRLRDDCVSFKTRVQQPSCPPATCVTRPGLGLAWNLIPLLLDPAAPNEVNFYGACCLHRHIQLARKEQRHTILPTLPQTILDYMMKYPSILPVFRSPPVTFFSPFLA